MPVIVQMNVYSGRADPEWVIDDDTFEKLLSLEVIDFDAENGGTRGLGYRGFTLRPSEERQCAVLRDRLGPNALHGAGFTRITFQPEIEEFLLGTAGDRVEKNALTHALKRLNTLTVSRAPLTRRCADPGTFWPNYLPSYWNWHPTLQAINNCYSYANDRLLSSGFRAEPGRGGGQTATIYTCDELIAASERDGLIHVPARNWRDVQLTDPTTQWRVVVVGVDWLSDYHWYRQDTRGCWSHKIGYDPVTDRDNVGLGIEDPKDAERGPYTMFCGYMITHRGAQIA